MFNSFPTPKPDGGGGIIKSLQRGSATLTSATGTSVNVTISAVDTTKTIVKILGFSTTDVAGSTASTIMVRGRLINATTVTLDVGSTPVASTTVTVQYEIIEYLNVKSLQVGTVSLGASASVTVSAVNPAKSDLYASYMTTSGSTNLPEYLISYNLTNPTTITFAGANATAKTVHYQLIEFQ